MMIKRNIKLLTGVILISFFLAACQPPPEPTPTVTATITPTHTMTVTPSPSSTRTPTSTITPTPEPTPTASHTPTQTVQWDDRGLSLTPIPPFSDVITTENANRVDALAVWGNGKANTIVLSPDNRILAVGTGIGAFLYESLNFIFITSFPTPFAVQSIAFSPDSFSIALGQSEGRIDIYNLITESLTARLSVPGVSFTSPHDMTVLFSQNGAYLTSIIEMDTDIYINRWSTGSWQPAGAFIIPTSLVSYINPLADLMGIIDGTNLTLQSLSFSEEATLIPLPLNEPLALWESIPAGSGEIAPSTAGDFILINNGNILLHWQLNQENITYRLNQYPTEMPDPCYDAPNSCRNTSGGFSWVCDAVRSIPPIETIVLAPDNGYVLVSRNDNRSEFRRTSDGLLFWVIDSQFTQVAFSTSMDFFFGLKPDGTIEKRANSDGELVFSLNQHPSQVFDLGFAPDGGALAVGHNDGWIRVYSPLNGELLGVLDGSASALEFSPDGRLLAAGLADGKVRVFELFEGRFYDLPGGHFSTVTGITFSSDGAALLTGSNDCTTSLWDLEGSFRSQNITPGGPDPFRITSVERSPINQSQYVLSKDYGIYQVLDSEITVLFAPPNISFSDLSLSPMGQLLAAAGPSTWLIPALDIETLGGVRELPPTEDRIAHALTFTPNGSVLIVAFTEGLEFWSVADGRQLAYLPFSPSSFGTNLPVDIQVSPDGSLIALGREDGLVHIFAVID